MRPAMSLLDTNMALIEEAKSLVNQQQVSLNMATETSTKDPSSVGSFTEDSPLSSVQPQSTADFASPGFSYDTPYFPHHSETTSPIDDTQHDFGFGLGSTGGWY
jgi:hypothetical protein